MQTLKELLALWDSHGTKILGSITATISTLVATALLIDGLIPEPHLKYWLYVNALFSGATVRRGFTNSPKAQKEEAPPEMGQRGFVRPLFLAFVLLVSAPIVGVMQGCAAPNPFAVAQTPEQQAMALYGTYQIAKTQAAALYADPATPDNVANFLKKANDAAAPPFDTLYKAMLAFKMAEEAAAQGTGTAEQTLLALNHMLDMYIKAKQPLADFQKAYASARKEAK